MRLICSFSHVSPARISLLHNQQWREQTNYVDNTVRNKCDRESRLILKCHKQWEPSRILQEVGLNYWQHKVIKLAAIRQVTVLY